MVSLFSGVGGLDLGLIRAGHSIAEMCESWGPARAVLEKRFPDIPLADDVQHFNPEPGFDVLAAGFPCTDLSHAGAKAGIFGPKSGLVEHVFRIAATTRPEWLVLENVPNLLALHRGAGMRYVVDQLEAHGYRWAYRTVDSRFTGVPQRRPRVIIVASRSYRPESFLLTDDVGEAEELPRDGWGFYWTEGRHGLGLVPGAIPTLKGGSTLGLPSAPAIWFPAAAKGKKFVLPDIEDGEALQGFDRGWTAPAGELPGPNHRWKLVGNAVTVGIGEWVGRCLQPHAEELIPVGSTIDREARWPHAGWGGDGEAWACNVSAWPKRAGYVTLTELVALDRVKPLSHRATTGFLSRLDESGRKVDARFYRDLEEHQNAMRPNLPPAWETSTETRRRMSGQRQKDTKPEIALRRELYRLGLRYQLQVRPDPKLRRRMDIVLRGAKVAVDVRGCFWHSCPAHRTMPKANAERWADKLAKNVRRDDETVALLEEKGWDVVVVWEHDDPLTMATAIAERVRARRRRPRVKASPHARPATAGVSYPANRVVA